MARRKFFSREVKSVRGCSSYDLERMRQSSNRKHTSRTVASALCVVRLMFCVLAVFVLVRLVDLQVISAASLSKRAEGCRTNVMALKAKRGTIYDRNGNVLALSVDCKTLYCNPEQVKDVAKTAQVLASVLGGDPSEYSSTLSKKTTFAYLKRQVDTGLSDKLKEALAYEKLGGIYQIRDTKRVYPYGSLAGQVLGFVGADGRGLSGLEYQYNRELAGTDGKMTLEVGAKGDPIAGGVSEVTEATNGTDLVLTLDANIQARAEKTIEEGISTYSAKSGSSMVIDPKTGEILAACSTPYLDLACISKMPNDAFNLKLTTDSYEPGSMFKILTMAVGVDCGALTPDTTFTVPGKIPVDKNFVVWDEDRRTKTVNMSVREIMRRSSNTGAILAGRAIGSDAFSAGISRFGIGMKTGIDYPGEAEGLVTRANDYGPATLAAMSFGQGVSVPMTQMVRAVGAVASGGVLKTPHFLSTKGDQKVSWPDGERAISQTTVATVTDLMRTVMTEGTGRGGRIDGYDIAGKTSTGEQVDPVKGGYQKNSFLASMVGFAPASDPQVLVYVGLSGVSCRASESSAHLFSTIMGEALAKKGILPA